MKQSKALETELTLWLDTYWKTYLSGDLDTWITFIKDDYYNIGGTKEEIWHNKEEILAYTTSILDQMIGQVDIRNRKVDVILYGDRVMVNEFTDLYIKIDGEWLFYGPFRMSSLLEKTDTGWIALHQHGSYPDMKATQGEVFAADALRAENLRLQEAVNQRTIELEEKNRELEIEAALEKVRSRSMAMHNSNDLLEVIKILSDQLFALGLKFDTANFAKVHKDGSWDLWSSTPHQSYPVQIYVPYFNHRIFTEIYEAEDRKESFFTSNYSFEEKNSFFKYVFENTAAKNVPDERKQYVLNRKGFFRSLFLLKNIWLSVVNYEGIPFTDDENTMLQRFANVFEQAYTRFLDLQKAEAQAREAQIEAALERTRTQSMIMQHSKELDDTLRVFHEQVLLLGINSAFSYLWLPDEENEKHKFWATWAEQQNSSTIFKSKALNYPLDRNEPATAKCLVDWKSDEPVHSYALLPGEVENYFANWAELLDGVEKLKPEHFVGGLYYVEAYMKYGCFGVMIERDLTEAEKKILGRFATEFERAYTRFLDLQKAEAQAREAKIEAALERVRSRSLAMHKSDELTEVVSIIFEKLKELQIAATAVGIGIYIDGSKDLNAFVCGENEAGLVITNYRLPYFHHKISEEFSNVREKQLDFFVGHYSKEEKNSFYKYVLEHTAELKHLPEDTKRMIFESPSYTITMVAVKNAVLNINDFEGKVLSGNEVDIIKRFARVFDQAYTRFLDLQKAEAQAREAKIEVSLERVRSRSMAMHKSDELKEAGELLWNELGKLGIPSLSSGYVLMDKEEKIGWIYAPNPATGKIAEAVGVLHTETKEMLAVLSYWKKQEPLSVIEMDEQETITHQTFIAEQSLQLDGTILRWITAEQLIALSPKKLFLHNFNFNQGYLLIVGGNRLTEEQVELMLRFTKVFEQTYTRFLDLQKAEAQAREAQIQLAVERVRARALAMFKSEEIMELVAKLKDEVMGLDIPDVVAATIFLKEGKDLIRMWDLSSLEKLDDVYQIPLDITFKLKSKDPHLYVKRVWENPDNYFVEIQDSKGFKRIIEWLRENNKNENAHEVEKFIESTQLQQLYHATKKLNNGKLCIDLLKPPPDEMESILTKMGAAFDLAYKRFEDLKNSEEQLREAQIEAALEKVRSRSLSMHKTDELQEVVTVVLERMTDLNIELDTININIYKEDSKEANLWTAAPGHKYAIPFHLPFFDHPFHTDIFTAKENGLGFFTKTYSYEEKNSYFNYTFEHTDFKNVPETKKKLIMEGRACTRSIAITKNAGIFIHRYSEKPFSESENEILKRFAKVFEQAYTRFLDLQKAEAQARESQIQLALERVRARTMAMQRSEELSKTVQLLFEEFKKLQSEPDGEILSRGFITIINEPKKCFDLTVTDIEGNEIKQFFKIDFTEPTQGKYLYDTWKNKQPSFISDLQGKQLNKWLDYLAGLNFPVAPGLYGTRRVNNYIFHSKGFIGITSSLPLSSESIELLERFAKVFDLTYTRFSDLKIAEAQTREGQIELALERVRARSMAMQKSDELADVATLLFHQFKNLELLPDIARVFFSLIDEKSASSEIWTTKEDGILRPGSHRVSLNTNKHLKSAFTSWKAKKTIYIGELTGKEVIDYLNYLSTMPHLKEDKILQHLLISPPDKLVFTEAFFKQGSIGIISADLLLTESQNTLTRFAIAFEQSYTRFLDLQKAEAQARDAQIEAALERVRSRSMAMHNSEDLKEVVVLLYKQLIGLGVTNFTTCGYVEINEQTGRQLTWVTNAGGDSLGLFHLPLTGDDVFDERYAAWKQQQAVFHQTVAGEKRNKHLEYAITTFGSKEAEEMVRNQFPDPTVFYCFNFSHGYLHLVTGAELNKEEESLLVRFTRVFEQTYTRFLDLQKAETQAREATIEAALEKVRGKAMAMHNSNDLLETAGMVFTELRKLGIKPMRAGVGLQNKENRKVLLYSATSSEEGDSLSMVGSALLDDHPVLTNIHDTWLRGEDYFFVMSGDLLKTYYEKVTNNFQVPDQAKAGLEHHGYFLSFSEGAFYGYYEQPISEDQLKTLHRFKAIIDLTFRRYLELQKSESIAKDAIRQASLDRVRAEIASMRTTEDLDRITPLVWSELTTLGIPFVRCGVFIMDDAQEQIHTFLSTPDGKAIAAFHLPYGTSNLTEALNYWRAKKMYLAHWGAQEFSVLADVLVEQKSIATREQYLSTLPKEGIHLHYLPFLQGMLYVGNTAVLNDDDLQLVQSLADAFSTAYARYEDFNKLEAAKQQVDKTLVDLKQAQQQLVQSEKMASLGELTAGIAHEIQNPLNFVNNFSEVNMELIDELKTEVRSLASLEMTEQLIDDIKANSEKINHHGKRAADIVKGMLQHSRSSSGVKEPTDINALCDEYLRLSYHGLRAKDKSFNATMKTDFDASIEKINIIPQDIGRVVLNLLTNAFYAVAQQSTIYNLQSGDKIDAYTPTVSVSTKKVDGMVEISVTDNGNGIPQKALDKIFQPFFTTKPTGQGTGLGLSLSYDIVKAHSGELKVETEEKVGTTFIIQIPNS